MLKSKRNPPFGVRPSKQVVAGSIPAGVASQVHENKDFSDARSALQMSRNGNETDTMSRNWRANTRKIPVLAAALVFSLFSCGELQASDIYAIDGDTIVIGREHIRLTNIDAPEIGHFKCDAEFRLGMVAKRRMEGLLASGTVTLVRGDHGRMKDRYGRSLARVLVDGKDAGEILVAEGLAREWDGKRHPWC